MSTALVDIELCSCGKTQSDPAHSKYGHQYVPAQLAYYLRPTQHYKAGYLAGRYSLKESRILKTAKPAAGADVKATVTGAAKWKIWALRAQLTTSAAVGNRVPHLQITDGPGGNVALDFPSPNNQVAGATEAYVGGAGLVAANFDNTQVFVLPVEVELLQGWTIGFSTTNLDAGDQWTALVLLMTETLFF